MTSARAFLLVLALFFAQLAAGMHAVEHGAGKEGLTTTHACQLCLAGHDLSSALPTVAVLPPVVAKVLVPDVLSFIGRSQLPPPWASQRAPPLA